MTQRTHIALIGCLVALLSAPALAQSESDQANSKESEREIASVDLGANVPEKDSLSFNTAGTEREPGFLYFKDLETGRGSSAAASLRFNERTLSTFTPRGGLLSNDSQSLASAGEPWTLGSFTPRNADAYVSLRYGGGADNEEGNALDIELSSSIRVQTVDVPGAVNNQSLAEAFNRQVYDVGLDIGYGGFNLGASLRSERGAFSDGVVGFDVGLSYSWSSWSTSLLVGEYSRRYNHIFPGQEDAQSNFYAVEIGASYRLNPALRFTGAFRYFGFQDPVLLDPTAPPRSQMFYLGTNLNF